MSNELTFLGWDQPCARLVADWLWQAPELLRRRLVVVPTRESGRQLRELLAEKSLQAGAGAVLGPRVATPDDCFRPEVTMPDSLRSAGWIKVLKKCSDAEVANLFPGGISRKDDAWRSGVGKQIEQARDLLASANLSFSSVQRSLSEEADRWAELAGLESKVSAVWKEWGVEDPVQAKLARAQHPAIPGGVNELVIAAVTDPTWLSIDSWKAAAGQGVRITILVCAPESKRSAFDEWGRPKPEFWTDRAQYSTPEPGSLVVAADGSGLAEAVVKNCVGRSNKDMAVGVCANGFIPPVSRRFQKAGWPTYDPQGATLARDGWPELLEALASVIEGSNDYKALSRLARHPFVWRSWLENGGVRSLLAALDDWEAKNCPSAAVATIKSLESSDNAKLKQCASLLRRIHSFAKVCQEDIAPLVAQLKGWASPSRDLHDFISGETASWQKIRDFSPPLLLRLLASAVSSIARDIEHPAEALPLKGWLELLFDPALHLVIAALHEGSVPEAPATNPLITEVLCERLQFRDRKSRLAREVYLYSAMVHGRRDTGSVAVVTAQVDPAGEPCRPSRVLLHAAADSLPTRVGCLIKEKPDVPSLATPPWSRGDWLIQPMPGTIRNRDWDHLSPSTLRQYLACPTRFYFMKVLGWEKFERFDEEMDARQFGNLFHDVFRVWGQDEAARFESNPQKLAGQWLGLLDTLVEQRFGKDLPPLLRLQVMSAQERLGALAKIQAKQSLEGWHVVDVERSLNHLRLAGLPVEMRVDRIDRHDDGRVRVIDYKTAKKGDAPKKTHLRVWKAETCPEPLGPLVEIKGRFYCWTDLQLPLYVRAVQEDMKLGAPPAACYAVLPEAVSDTDFEAFEELPDLLGSAMAWADEAAKRILDGVFWPPVAKPVYDDFDGIAPDGLEQALGDKWRTLLAGRNGDGLGQTGESGGRKP